MPRFKRMIQLGLLLTLLGAAGCPSLRLPVLLVYPTAVSFGSDRTADTINIANWGGGALTWTVNEDIPWLTVQPASGTTGSAVSTLTLTADRTGLTLGDHTESFTIESNGGSQTVWVNITYAIPPDLAVGTTQLDFGAQETTLTFEIENTGSEELDWSIAVSPTTATWLTASPSSGSMGAGANTVTARVTRGSLDRGEYEAELRITSNGGAATIDVVMEVAEPQPELSVDPAQLVFETGEQADTFTVRNTGAATLRWNIVQDLPDWLDVSPLSGSTAGSTTVNVTVNRTGLAADEYVHTIQVQSLDNENNVLETADVSVRLIVPEPAPILEVEPLVLDFGQQLDEALLSVRNVGTAPLGWTATPGAAWISVDPATGTLDPGAASVTVTVDREIAGAGTQESSIAFTSNGGDLTVTVHVQVRPPTLSVTPDTIDFGTTGQTNIIAIWNSGIGDVAWQVDAAGFPGWLSLDPPSAQVSGSVRGEETNAVTLRVNREGLDPGRYTFDSPGVTVASDAGTFYVRVYMTIVEVPELAIIGDGTTEGGVPFVYVPDDANTAVFLVRNAGTGNLTWSFGDLADRPNWITSIAPLSGSLAQDQTQIVTVSIDRTGLSAQGYSYTAPITSNGGDNAIQIEMTVPPKAVIGVDLGQLNFMGTAITASFNVANMGDPATVLDFYVEVDKRWVFLYPRTGQSIGTALPIKDWQEVNVSIDRGGLEQTGAVATISVHAYELGEAGEIIFLDEEFPPQTLAVSVAAAPLTFETARARTRIPSLVRFIWMLRDFRYRSIALAEELLPELNSAFQISEGTVPLELSETNQFLTTATRTRTNLAVVLDYSGSMYESAQTVFPDSRDALQELYAGDPDDPTDLGTIGTLITELPDTYRIALMIFHDRSQPTRIWAPDGGEPFVTDKSLLLQRLDLLSVEDHGATELLPATEEAALLLAAEDFPLISFDNADVRAIVMITDGRLTTPPGKIKDTIDLLYDVLNTRFFAIGWGLNVNHEPLARLGAATGGHYYPTYSDEANMPRAEALYDWCHTSTGPDEDVYEDSVLVEPWQCDQSVPRDLRSQVVFSYVTLNEGQDVPVQVNGGFDNPNDDDGLCIPDQGMIRGSFQQKIKMAPLVGDTRLGQLSMRTDGVINNAATILVRGEYMPRNIRRISLTLASTPAQPFTVSIVPNADGGLVEGWAFAQTDTSGGNGTSWAITVDAPGGVPLQYGAFGDLFRVEFATVGASPFLLELWVDNSIYVDPLRPTETKYFIYPDTITVGGESAFAPAFPTALVTPMTLDFGTDVSTAQFTIRNVGGTFPFPDPNPTIALHWDLAGQPQGISLRPRGGYLLGGTQDIDQVTVTLDRSFEPGVTNGTIDLNYDTGDLGLEGAVSIGITYTIQPPQISVTPNRLDFGSLATELPLQITNTGQSTMEWEIQMPGAPDWFSVSSDGGTTSSDPVTVYVYVDRAGLPPPLSGVYETEIEVFGYDFRGEVIGGGPVVVPVAMTVAAVKPTPAEIDFGSTGTTATFTLENISDSLLVTWNAEGPTWITSISPSSGNLAAEAQVQVALQVDRTGLSTGIHDGTLMIRSDRGEARVLLHVTVPVSP